MKLNHVLSTRQFSDPLILQRLFELALEMEKNIHSGKLFPVLNGKVMAALFYEPSTRTRFSFESAMNRLGGRVISTESAGHFSSATKGETLEDTIRIIAGYSDVVVLRHPEEGAAARAANISSVPIINAGDGIGEHPTQALLDAYTIWREKGRLHDLNILIMGDLLYGRTVHSLLRLLESEKNIHVYLVSPPTLRLPETYRNELKNASVSFEERDSIPENLENVDVLYMTRVQKERFASAEAYAHVKDSCAISMSTMNKLPPDAIVMPPLPRVNEIPAEIDQDPRAAYFRQATNGLYVRMALLELLFEKRSLEQDTLRVSEKGFFKI